MGQVTVTLNGRTYRLSCGEGEEQRLLALAAHVRERIEALSTEFGHSGDDRLLLMAALLVTDELFDARDRLMEAIGPQQPATDGDDMPDAIPAQVAAPPPVASAAPAAGPQRPPQQAPQRPAVQARPQQPAPRGDLRPPQRGPIAAQRPTRVAES